jgi:hypothetical protein
MACIHINNLPLDVLKVLIETHGADVNGQDNNNDTPIHLVFLHFYPHNQGVITILTYLLSHKSIIFNIKGQNYRNLLHWASTCGIAPDSDDDYSDDFTESEDDSDEDLDDELDDSDNSVKAKGDDIWFQIVEMILENCLEQILDERRF